MNTQFFGITQNAQWDWVKEKYVMKVNFLYDKKIN